MNAVTVIACATLSAVAGDNLGFALGRWGGRRLAARISRWVGGEQRLEQAEEHARHWGCPGIFLISPSIFVTYIITSGFQQPL
jgi:membrane protein DedA with SNARE-associated domain